MFGRGTPPGLGKGDRKEGRSGQWTGDPRVTSRDFPSHWVLTRSGDVGYVAGITDIVISKGHEAELIEHVLRIRGGGPWSGSGPALPTTVPFVKTVVGR